MVARASGVTDFHVGDRVLGIANNGAFADQLTIASDKLVKVPNNLSAEVAAGFFINYATALYGLRDCGKLQAGENILILGAAGGVGSSAISVAKAMGATVIAAASNLEKRQAALSFGADYSVDYTNPNWRQALKTLTGKQGSMSCMTLWAATKQSPHFAHWPRAVIPGRGFRRWRNPKFHLTWLCSNAPPSSGWIGVEMRANPPLIRL